MLRLSCRAEIFRYLWKKRVHFSWRHDIFNAGTKTSVRYWIWETGCDLCATFCLSRTMKDPQNDLRVDMKCTTSPFYRPDICQIHRNPTSYDIRSVLARRETRCTFWKIWIMPPLDIEKGRDNEMHEAVILNSIQSIIERVFDLFIEW